MEHYYGDFGFDPNMEESPDTRKIIYENSLILKYYARINNYFKYIIDSTDGYLKECIYFLNKSIEELTHNRNCWALKKVCTEDIKKMEEIIDLMTNQKLYIESLMICTNEGEGE